MGAQPALLGDDIGSSGLERGTNWWGAFVIGLAGTILVTGIDPVMVSAFGAAAIPQIAVITVSGYLLCLLLAELSAMMPDRTGGSPSYAMVAYRDRWPRLSLHINGGTAWAYWLGWFPVAPLNMIIASTYIGQLFHIKAGSVGTITLWSYAITYQTLVISVVGILALFIPAYLGIRLGAMFATVLGILSMVPLTVLAVGGIFKANWGSLSGFQQVDSAHPGHLISFFGTNFGHNWFLTYTAYAFLLTWNVIAMEAAACYIGECRNPARDAKIAMNLEGAYGAFIYIMIAVSFVVVVGPIALQKLGTAPNTVFLAYADSLFGSSGYLLKWGVGLMLIIALMLSALNAIMGCARGLYQISIDGQLPRIFGRVNKHGVPDAAMFFNVLCSIFVVFLGGAVEIYTFSNVGYLSSFLPVLLGYYLLRRWKPDAHRPVRLPSYFKYIALVMFVVYLFIWLVGGPLFASYPILDSAGKSLGDATIYYILGIAFLLTYVPLYWYRQWDDRRRGGPTIEPDKTPPASAGD